VDGVKAVGDGVRIVVKGVRVPVEAHGRLRVTEHALDGLDVRAGRHGEADWR
jgi:hypothetical protein